MTRNMARAVAGFLQQYDLDVHVVPTSEQTRTPSDGWAVQINEAQRGPLFAITNVLSLSASET